MKAIQNLTVAVVMFLFGCQQGKETISQPAEEKLGLNAAVSKSVVDYSLMVEEDSITRILTFSKHKDSVNYSHLKYSCRGEEQPSFRKELQYIDYLWTMAADSIDIALRTAAVGYPLMYSDISVKHIEAFDNDKTWQAHIKSKGKEVDISLIKKIMLEREVYGGLSEVLKNHDYNITGISTEKHGFLSPQDLKSLGYTGDEKIPMPFMVVIKTSLVSD